MGLEPVILGTVCFSPKINVLRQYAPIYETCVVEKQADFDPVAFIETKFLDTSDPVGSELIAPIEGNRYIDQNWYYKTGLRKNTLSGAQVELSQQIGYEDSNSQWFTPPLQGTSRITLSITQPLLRGAGKMYNSSAILLAQIDAQSCATKRRKIFRSTCWKSATLTGISIFSGRGSCRNADSTRGASRFAVSSRRAATSMR